MNISTEIITGFLQCKYKAHLLLKNTEPDKSTETVRIRLEMETEEDLRANTLLRNEVNVPEKNATNADLTEGLPLLFNFTSSWKDGLLRFDALERIAGKSELGSFSYIPAITHNTHLAPKDIRLLLGVMGLALQERQKVMPPYGKYYTSDQDRFVRVKLDSIKAKTWNIVEQIEGIRKGKPPLFRLNDHCRLCQFQSSCKNSAMEKDDLSLIKGLSVKEIGKLNKKGIFSVFQLSHTFRPRRQKTRKYGRYLHELKALAIREKRVHIIQQPDLPVAPVSIYCDIEGDPDRSVDYLIGLLIVTEDGKEYRHEFWSDSDEDEVSMFLKFCDVIAKYSDFCLFHFGNYERKSFARIKDRLSEEYKSIIERIEDHAVNVLTIIYNNVYFPTYTNSLKEIGPFLQCSWTDKDASGLTSILWRKKWATSQKNEWKQRLITYNKEDCDALRAVVNFLRTINAQRSADPNLVWTQDIKNEKLYGFRRNNFYCKEFDFVNDCAYFDYQRDRVYVRTNKNVQKVQRVLNPRKIFIRKINKVIRVPSPDRCTQCSSGKIKGLERWSHTQMELVFFKFGVKKWFVQYQARRFRCRVCKTFFFALYYARLHGRYGNNLISWVIYQKIVNRQSYDQIYRTLNDFFGVTMTRATLHSFKSEKAAFYRSAYDDMLRRLAMGNALHVDETNGKVRRQGGYVWIFTNMNETCFVYKDSREGEFLKELLQSFKGVLISDFYSAYDGINCPQQKCLVHLIRDFNDDVLKNPFDEAFKSLAQSFADLLKDIVVTIDQYGLKARHLYKHKTAVRKFFRMVERDGKSSPSELVRKYTKKLLKNQSKLFTFLDYDNIPWNNNNAEHAIKSFVMYRRDSEGLFSPQTIQDYLVLFSMYRTCQLNGVDFLDFLLSQEPTINDFIKNNTMRRKKVYEHIFPKRR